MCARSCRDNIAFFWFKGRSRRQSEVPLCNLQILVLRCTASSLACVPLPVRPLSAPSSYQHFDDILLRCPARCTYHWRQGKEKESKRSLNNNKTFALFLPPPLCSVLATFPPCFHSLSTLPLPLLPSSSCVTKPLRAQELMWQKLSRGKGGRKRGEGGRIRIDEVSSREPQLWQQKEDAGKK